MTVPRSPITRTSKASTCWRPGSTSPTAARLQVADEGRFTRPSASSQQAPGFTGSLTTTIIYPQLRPGSRTHIKFRRVQLTPPLLGFNAWSQAEAVDPAVQDRMEIDLPTSLGLHWCSRGAVTVTDNVEGDRRRIVAEMAPSPGHEPERSAVDASDYQPIFLASTVPDRQAIGAIYYRLSQGRAAVTPEIAALAAKIVGDRTGLEAAHAIYDWVTVNIRYIALTLNPNDGWVPHPAAEVLAAGYGDCKDHAVLMEALLAARGIVGQSALVQWGHRYADLPMAHPFEFNHVIVYLPDYDLWLNPTDPYAAFGSLDRALSGKLVVIATRAGQVARTPASTPASYRYAIESRIAIDAEGTITGTASWSMSPNVDASIRATLASASSPSDLMERLLLGTPEGGFGNFKVSDPRDLATPLAISASWRSPHGVTLRSGATAITVPDGPDLEPASRLRRYLSPDGVRRTPMLVGASELSWTTTIALPPGVVATRLPEDVDCATRAGRYTARYRHVAATVQVSRMLVVDHDVFQPAEYPELERLIYAALDDARSTLTLARAEAVAERPQPVSSRKE